MQDPTAGPRDERVAALAARHGFSTAAAEALLAAIVRGRGKMAQFDHPDLDGVDQWMDGGMTMVGDMFNAALAHRLAIQRSGKVAVYDTLDHRIGGVAQQQGGAASLSFTSQHGPVDVERLPRVA